MRSRRDPSRHRQIQIEQIQDVDEPTITIDGELNRYDIMYVKFQTETLRAFLHVGSVMHIPRCPHMRTSDFICSLPLFSREGFRSNLATPSRCENMVL